MSEDRPIEITMTVGYATVIASLLQIALKNPGIALDTPTLYTDGCKIYDDLVRAIADRLPNITVVEIFSEGWSARHAVTADEFDRMMENSLNADENEPA